MRSVDRFISSVIAVGSLELVWHIPKLQMIIYDLAFKLRAIAFIFLIFAAAVFMLWFLTYSLLLVCKVLYAWWTSTARTDMPINATPWHRIVHIWKFHTQFVVRGVGSFLVTAFVLLHFVFLSLCVVYSLEFHHGLLASSMTFLALFFATCYIGDAKGSDRQSPLSTKVQTAFKDVDENIVKGFRSLFQKKKPQASPMSKAAKKALHAKSPPPPHLAPPGLSSSLNSSLTARLRAFAHSTDQMLVNFVVAVVGWLLFFFGLAVVLFVIACIPHEFDHYSQSVVNRHSFSYHWVDQFLSSNLHSSATQSSSLTCQYNHTTAVANVLSDVLTDPRTYSVVKDKPVLVLCQVTWETPVRHIATNMTLDPILAVPSADGVTTESADVDSGACKATALQISTSTDGSSWTHTDLDHANIVQKYSPAFTQFRLQFKARPKCRFKFHCETKIAYQEEAYARFSQFSKSQTTPFWEKVLGVTNSVARSLMEGKDDTSNVDPLVIWYRTHWGSCSTNAKASTAMTCRSRQLTSSEMWHDLYSAVEKHFDVDYFKSLVPELLVATKYWASIAFELTSNTVLSLIDFFVCYSVFLHVLNWMTRSSNGKDTTHGTVFAHHLKLILPFQESVVEKICSVFTDKVQ
jgi:hypothetical protein